MPTFHSRRVAVLATLVASVLCGGVAGAEEPRDPVRRDPSPTLTPPAALAEITIPSAGSRLHGLLYLAAGAGPHPVVVFLHGYPGNERNLDLAQAVRRAGFDALFFDYRGNWGSGGTFSFAHGLEDARAALAWVRSAENAAKYHFDPARLALVGHSFGGWLALMTAGSEPTTVCVAALAAWNIGWDGKRFATHETERQASLADLRDTADPADGPIRARPEDLQREIAQNAAAWDYLGQAAALRGRPMLLMASTRDTPDEDIAMHEQLAQALRAAGNKDVLVAKFEDDHSFSSHRLAVADALIGWLRADCARGQVAPAAPPH